MEAFPGDTCRPGAPPPVGKKFSRIVPEAASANDGAPPAAVNVAADPPDEKAALKEDSDEATDTVRLSNNSVTAITRTRTISDVWEQLLLACGKDGYACATTLTALGDNPNVLDNLLCIVPR
ncbi:unnamed protein product, partial [Amoebophrya sp. A120]|eukprot:GSA120T00018060001.1